MKPCVMWEGSLASYGYGRRWVPGRGMVRAHRWVWEQANGPIPDGMNVCHRCDTPGCIELTHLFLGSQAVNLADMRAKGRGATGERHGHARLTAELAEWVRANCRPGDSEWGINATARRLGVTRAAIQGILTGRTWRT